MKHSYLSPGFANLDLWNDFFSFFYPSNFGLFLGMTALSLHFFRDESQSSFFSKNASHRFLSYFFWSMSIVSIKNTKKNTCRNHICNCYFNWKPVVAFFVALWLSENSTVWGPSFAFGEVCRKTLLRIGIFSGEISGNIFTHLDDFVAKVTPSIY